MWLILRNHPSRAALDLTHAHIWYSAGDRCVRIDFADGELTISFESDDTAVVAAEYLLQAIRNRQEFVDTADAEWGRFQGEWQWFDSSREEQPSGTPPEGTDNHEKQDLWEGNPPIDDELRRFWQLAEPVRHSLRPKRADVEQIILQVCQDTFRSAQQIAKVLERSAGSVRSDFLVPDGKRWST